MEFLNRSQDVIRNSNRLHKSIIDMEGYFNEFLLTKDSSVFDKYENRLQEIPTVFKSQRLLVMENKEQAAILDSIEILNTAWVSYADSQIDRQAHAGHGPEAEHDHASSGSNYKSGIRVKSLLAQKFQLFDRLEYETRERHRENLESSIHHTHTFSLTFLILTIVIGIITTIYIISVISKRIKTMVRFAENISEGKFDILEDNKKDELTSLSVSLNAMSDSLRRNITELENRNMELDKFAHVVSHDLKAPVRGIHNVVTWIEEDHAGELTPSIKNYLDIIIQRTKRMEDLINGLLDYARLRKKNPNENTDVHQMVSEIVETIVPRNFKVEIKNLPVIFTDKLNLEQVFTNLISNAVKYTLQDEGEIVIESISHPHYFEFSVRDNGIGIEPEYHEKIFEMFQTLREKDEKESTGIGLAIIKKILDDSHETIRVRSNLGEGTTFIFTWTAKKI
jgi:signal transduction histidine kinase